MKPIYSNVFCVMNNKENHSCKAKWNSLNLK
jgi:hypothetical protein